MLHPYPHTMAEIIENDWEEITERDYHRLLGAVPPAHRDGTVFAVGEPLCHLEDGRVVYTTCAGVDGKFYRKPWPGGPSFDGTKIVMDILAQIDGEEGGSLMRELLVALQKMVAAFGHESHDAIDQAEDAIAKAEKRLGRLFDGAEVQA